MLAAAAVFPTTPVRTGAGMLPLNSVMVAIAGAEDGYGISPGDKVSPGSEYWSCNNYTSFGVWQVHIPTWHSLIYTLSGGLTSPCDMASWLGNYHNCALVANRIVNGGAGLHNWTTWWSRDGGKTSAGDGNGLFLQFLSTASATVPSATSTAPASTPSTAPNRVTMTAGIGTIDALDAGLALGGVILLAVLLKRAVS